MTRCALRLDTGEVSHAYLKGRRKADAEAAAIFDALMQTDLADHVRATVPKPLAAEREPTHAKRARKAALTKVDLVIVTRGEN
ncbi:MAG: phosphonate C-P lyase system protein PhnG [Pseudomonadota bacterium]